MIFKHYRDTRILGVLLVCICLGVGCGRSLQELEGTSAEHIFQEGVAYYEQGDYKAALQRFQYVKDTFIRSPYAGPTRFYAGETYFALEKYEEAVIEYTSFLSFFPNDPNAVIAQYKLGLSYFEQSLGPERDQRMLHTALKELENVRLEYPDRQEYIEKAEEAMQKVRNELALHEYLVAEFYHKEENYTASNRRVAYLLEHYPNSDRVGDAVFLSGLNALELEQPEEAKAHFLTLLQHYPANQHIAEARKQLTRLGVTDFPEPVQKAQNSGIILRCDGELVFTDVVRKNGAEEGIVMEVYRRHDLIGTIRIIEIHEKFSIGKIESLDSDKTIQQNDTVTIP